MGRPRKIDRILSAEERAKLDAVNAKNRERYRTDPEYRARLIASTEKYQKKRRADPVQHEQLKAVARARGQTEKGKASRKKAWEVWYAKNSEDLNRKKKAQRDANPDLRAEESRKQKARVANNPAMKEHANELRRIRMADPAYKAEVNRKRREKSKLFPEKREAENARKRERYASDDEYRARQHANRNAWVAAHPDYEVAINLRIRLVVALKKFKVSKRVSAVADLGCTIEEFADYIESKFLPGMTWDLWGKGQGKWHLDHIRPFASFNMTDPEQQKAAVHFSNMQPLWAIDNLSKGANWDGEGYTPRRRGK